MTLVMGGSVASDEIDNMTLYAVIIPTTITVYLATVNNNTYHVGYKYSVWNKDFVNYGDIAVRDTSSAGATNVSSVTKNVQNNGLISNVSWNLNGYGWTAYCSSLIDVGFKIDLGDYTKATVTYGHHHYVSKDGQSSYNEIYANDTVNRIGKGTPSVDSNFVQTYYTDVDGRIVTYGHGDRYEVPDSAGHNGLYQYDGWVYVATYIKSIVLTVE